MSRQVKPIKPGPGQESVWDYPRPPKLERTDSRIVVQHANATIADTHRAWRVLETSHPPSYYLPPEDIDMELLAQSSRQSFCEWKGSATYFDIVAGHETVPGAAWTYRDPIEAFSALRNHVSFYPQLVDACWVDGERVAPVEGSFYGGWVTSTVVGPFKGGPGTMGW
jgi:uncharacterized protein (DUF427 family)